MRKATEIKKNKAVEMTVQEEAVALGYVLEHGDTEMSLHIRAIQHTQKLIDGAADPLAKANQIISMFGCSPVADVNQARIIAKGLAEQIVVQGLTYDPEVAMRVVADKLVKIERTMPWVFAGGNATVTPTLGVATGGKIGKEKKPKRGGDKKDRALAIFNEMRGKNPKVSASDVAKEIEKRENDMTFANAYYYVTRVFEKKYGSKPTAKKGR